MRFSCSTFRSITLGALAAIMGMDCSFSPDLTQPVEENMTRIASAGDISVGTGTLDKIPVNQFKGLNWGYNRTQPDLGNYSRGTLRLPLLDLSDPIATVVQKTNMVLDNFLNAGANTIRIPINMETVNNKWANYYHYVVTTALNRNFKVILCYWLDATNKLSDIENVKKMYHALAEYYYYDNVHKVYPLVFYELANEPCGYLQNGSDYLPDIKNITNYLQTDFPGIKKRILVGGTDYSAYPGPVAVDADLQDCYLAVHFYETWAHDYSTNLKGLKYYPQYFSDALSYQIRWRNGVMDPNASSWYSRIIITEYGQWTDRDYGYTSKTTQRTATSITPNITYANDVEGYRIAYIFGTGYIVNRLQLGSVMWGGLIEDGYSLFKITANPTGLARNDYSATTQLTELYLPLRAVFFGALPTNGTYSIANVNPQYSLATSATNGTVSLNPAGGIYSSGTTVMLTAAPAVGYAFSGWTGDLTGTTNPLAVSMFANKSVTANFVVSPITVTYEAENLTRTASSVGSNVSTGDTRNSNSAYVQLSGTPATGAWLEFTLPNLTAAMYNIKLYFKAGNNRGICQGSVDGVNMGATCDEYRSATAYQVLVDIGSKALLAGSHKIRLTVTGKNPASTGYTMTVDKIVLTSTPTYTLNFAAANGSVTLNPAGGTYTSGTVVTLTATPAAGYSFSGWSRDLTGAANPATVTMSANLSLTANFTSTPNYTLTTSATNGSITLSPAGGTYRSGTVVTLTATPATGYAFSGWSGDITGTTNPATITMTADKSMAATFTALPQYTLTTSSTNGIIALAPAGGTYYEGATVTLTATPDAGYKFSGWSGDLTVTTTPATITMDADKNIAAIFTAIPTYTLTTSATNGTITLNPPGGAYYEGTAVKLTAAPASGYKFTGWSEPLSGTTNPLTVTMTADMSAGATFTAIPRYTILTSATNGTITLNPPGDTYDEGTVVTLTAAPAVGFTFGSWNGDLTGTTNPASVTMTANKSVAANFIPRYTLTTTATNGTVSLNPAGGTYNTGTVVTLTATPASGYAFNNWSGDLTGTTSPATVTMTANKSVTATFKSVAPLWASDLAWTQVANGWGPVEKDKSNGEAAAGDGKTITLGGVTYVKGFGCHANAEIRIPLNGAYQTFTSDIGVDDEVGSSGSVVFQIVADGMIKFTSATKTGSSATQTVSIDVTGVTTLNLKVTDAGNGNAKDHADWAAAKLTPKN